MVGGETLQAAVLWMAEVRAQAQTACSLTITSALERG